MGDLDWPLPKEGLRSQNPPPALARDRVGLFVPISSGAGVWGPRAWCPSDLLFPGLSLPLWQGVRSLLRPVCRWPHLPGLGHGWFWPPQARGLRTSWPSCPGWVGLRAWQCPWLGAWCRWCGWKAAGLSGSLPSRTRLWGRPRQHPLSPAGPRDVELVGVQSRSPGPPGSPSWTESSWRGSSAAVGRASRQALCCRQSRGLWLWQVGSPGPASP